MQLDDYQRIWHEKPVLRTIYNDLYRKIEGAVCEGDILEIGGGIGNLNLSYGEFVRSDIQYSLGVDVVTDAHQLPFNSGAFSNIILFDVLHHIQCPLLFFAEARRVLRSGGRVIMVEPGITPVSGLLYKMVHEEPVDINWNMSAPCEINADRDPYESNQAIPTILFKRDYKRFVREVGGFKIKQADWLSLFAYPLSGGFKSWSLIPNICVKPLLNIEEKLLPLLGGLMAFRLMVVLELDFGEEHQDE